ncbi:DUF3742 family protein [Cupriavidus basilensis]|uniref:DUF3742 family protein n=1 Tax=Cupriavidus basilensis TaxID=68895 RepID=A0ABT6ATX6_9BURK|nr:DUF3742 family protein [Cupriavidus basilensis]MDF3836072.1 DUF3742 family protein [Cupriavidus basilensis]
MPIGLAKDLLWVPKLLVLIVLLYAAFWLTLRLVFALPGAAAIRIDARKPYEAGEWRHGDEGCGYYEKDIRTDHGRLFDEDDE